VRKASLINHRVTNRIIEAIRTRKRTNPQLFIKAYHVPSHITSKEKSTGTKKDAIEKQL